jgi:hypothetical protein
LAEFRGKALQELIILEIHRREIDFLQAFHDSDSASG